MGWAEILAGYPDAEVFHSPAWLDFLAASQRAEPVVAVVHARERQVGHFVGAIVQRFGIRMLGSPLMGWGTQYMGFLLEEGADRRSAADALISFAFADLRCLHVELADRLLTAQSMAGSRYRAESGQTFVVDLDREEALILADMRSTTRNYIRQASRKGLRAESATGLEYADEYYAQLIEVFGRQGLAPTYGPERVRQLIRAIQPTDQLLLMRVRSPDGTSIATSVTVGRNQTAILWGTASLKSKDGFHPNELLHWEIMRHWRARGIVRYDMGGGGSYKAKYGGTVLPRAHFYSSRYAGMRHGRNVFRTIVKAKQIIAGLISGRSRGLGGRDKLRP